MKTKPDSRTEWLKRRRSRLQQELTFIVGEEIPSQQGILDRKIEVQELRRQIQECDKLLGNKVA